MVRTLWPTVKKYVCDVKTHLSELKKNSLKIFFREKKVLKGGNKKYKTKYPHIKDDKASQTILYLYDKRKCD